MKIYRLQNGVKHYSWGDTAFIPELLGLDNTEKLPFAELWMGTHPSLPSSIESDGVFKPIEEVVGESFPYLMKILSAAKPLSIQAHPSVKHAKEGFFREQEACIPMDSPYRLYKDASHKPELLCALTDFYALCGFRKDTPQELKDIKADSLKGLFQKLMTMPQSDVDSVLGPIIERLQGKDFERKDREYWVLRCHELFSEEGHFDRGLVSVYLMNLVCLRPTNAIYFDAGTLHAYLEGSGIEIMANSDNVLRGGLTSKHIDIQELLKVVAFRGEVPHVLSPEQLGQGEWRYNTPAKEFELRRIEDYCYCASDHEPEILIVVKGNFVVDDIYLERGDSVLVLHGVGYSVKGSGILYKATIPKC